MSIFILSFRNKHEATRDMLFSKRKYTMINQGTQTCNEISYLFEKNKKTLKSKKSQFEKPCSQMSKPWTASRIVDGIDGQSPHRSRSQA